MREVRELQRDEIPSVWSIDRTELIENLYLYQNGELVLSKQRFDMKVGQKVNLKPIPLICWKVMTKGRYFLGFLSRAS